MTGTIVCPHCGSEMLDCQSVEVESGSAYQDGICTDCQRPVRIEFRLVCVHPVEEEPAPTTTCCKCHQDFRDRDMMPAGAAFEDGFGDGELCPGCFKAITKATEIRDALRDLAEQADAANKLTQGILIDGLDLENLDLRAGDDPEDGFLGLTIGEHGPRAIEILIDRIGRGGLDVDQGIRLQNHLTRMLGQGGPWIDTMAAWRALD